MPDESASHASEAGADNSVPSSAAAGRPRLLIPYGLTKGGQPKRQRPDTFAQMIATEWATRGMGVWLVDHDSQDQAQSWPRQ